MRGGWCGAIPRVLALSSYEGLSSVPYPEDLADNSGETIWKRMLRSARVVTHEERAYPFAAHERGSQTGAAARVETTHSCESGDTDIRADAIGALAFAGRRWGRGRGETRSYRLDAINPRALLSGEARG